MGNIELVSYKPQYRDVFRLLNEEWITKYFKLEEEDIKILNDPEAYILKDGGYIVFALLDGEPVGTCALIKMENGTYELAKMAVSPSAQGKGIAFMIGQVIIDKARQLGAKRIHLESNTVLTPAIKLYYKLGFSKIENEPSPYERCNIQMELRLR